ncbi:MAG: glucoamylase family protein, partial [Bdellovibrionota bacterium]
QYQGTVCIGCAIGSIMFSPQEILEDARKWKTGPLGGKLWGRYGFVDGLDLDRKWTAKHVLGITVGPGYMSAANADDTTSIWQRFMKIEAVKRGLERARH